MDRFDLRVEVPPVAWSDLDMPATGETSEVIAARVATARALQAARFEGIDKVRVNADASGALLESIAPLDADGRELLARAAERMGLTARGYHRVLRVARTIADLAGAQDITRAHLAEAVSFRLSYGSG
jgi:magnesium chelatase family protein